MSNSPPSTPPTSRSSGIFVPFHAKPRGKQSANVGWITDANGCDIWQGAKAGKGYGQVNVNGRLCYVHRVRYEREIGPIPEGYQLDHFICDNGAGGCCNPFHCRPVTTRENLLRGNGVSSASAAKTHCPKGHPLSGENLAKYFLLVRGERDCRTCHNDRARAYSRSKREGSSAA